MSEAQKGHLAFALLFLSSLAAFWGPLENVANLSLRDDRYSHLLLIPPVVGFLFYSKRKNAFLAARHDITRGLAVLSLGAALYAAAELTPRWSSPGWPSQDVLLSIAVCSIVTVWNGEFLLCYGKETFRDALFPLLFLFLLVPLPSAVLDKAVVTLQHGSADTAYLLFRLLRIPVLAQGVNLSLPGVDIEVAKECSGIRSGESLVITSILAGYYLLQSAWSRIGLVLLSVPIAIVKNAIRIATISSLGIYVNPAFFYGKLHRNGGLPFSFVALAMIALPLLLFRAWEASSRKEMASGKVQC